MMVVDKADRALRDDLLQMQLHDLAPGQRFSGHGLGQEGKAQLAFHQREHLVGGGGLGVGLEHRAVVQEELPVKAAGHALLAQADEGVAAQLLQGQALAGQRREVPAAHQHLIKGHQLHHFQADIHLGGGGHDGKIHLAVLHGLHRLRGGVVGDAQPDAGVLGVEGPQFFRKIDVQRGLGGTDADGTVFQRGAGAQFFLRILDLYRRRRDAGIEHRTLGRQGHAPVGADEQHAVQLAFQPVHGVGDVGLVVAQHPGGFGKILILRNIIEDFVVFPVHIHGSRPSFISKSYCDHVQDTFYTFSCCSYNSNCNRELQEGNSKRVYQVV